MVKILKNKPKSIANIKIKALAKMTEVLFIKY